VISAMCCCPFSVDSSCDWVSAEISSFFFLIFHPPVSAIPLPFFPLGFSNRAFFPSSLHRLPFTVFFLVLLLFFFCRRLFGHENPPAPVWVYVLLCSPPCRLSEFHDLGSCLLIFPGLARPPQKPIVSPCRGDPTDNPPPPFPSRPHFVSSIHGQPFLLFLFPQIGLNAGIPSLSTGTISTSSGFFIPFI